MGYCYFGRCECSLLMENGSCANDTIDKCIHPAAVEDYKNAYKYIEHEPPKPNPDLVVVTRCKDCRHRSLEDNVWACPFGLPGGPEFFCSYGMDGKDGNEHG